MLVDSALEEWASEHRIEEVPQLVVKHVRNQRSLVVERLLADIEELEYLDTILAISDHATTYRGCTLVDVLLAVSKACPRAGYPEWTAVWMLCEELGLDVTPTLIVSELRRSREYNRRLDRSLFYYHYITRPKSMYYPNWAKAEGMKDSTFERMKKAALVAFPMLKCLKA